MRRLTRILPLLVAGVAFLSLDLLYTRSAEAVPAFARKLNKSCSGCHMAWPLLNKAGRQFRENGFRVSRKDKPTNVISDFLKLDETTPVSAVVKGRPYDEKSSGDAKVRAVHEVEIMLSGLLAKDVSVFFELEGEDEESFAVSVGEARVGYHPMEALNFLVSYGSPFVADNSDTLSSRRLTRGRNSVIDQTFGGADNGGKIRSNHQTVQVYGRVMEKLFYNLGFGGVASDAEGVKAGNFNGRLAVDVIPELTLGLFGLTGECAPENSGCAIKRDFRRLGLDAQADYRNVRLQAAFLSADDDRSTAGAGKDENTAWYVSAAYAFQKDKRPLFVPMVRFDRYEKSNGVDDYDEITLNLTYYLYENVKVFAEYWDQLSVPSGVVGDNRITLQIEIGF